MSEKRNPHLVMGAKGDVATLLPNFA